MATRPRRRRGGNNQGRNTGLGSLSTGRLKTVGFAPAAANRGAGGNQRNAASRGGLSDRRKSNSNTASFGGFNAAAFGVKANGGNAARTGQGGNPGASGQGSQSRRRGKNNGAAGDNFSGAGAATTTGRSRSSDG